MQLGLCNDAIDERRPKHRERQVKELDARDWADLCSTTFKQRVDWRAGGLVKGRAKGGIVEAKQVVKCGV